jgi:hypothetical protein
MCSGFRVSSKFGLERMRDQVGAMAWAWRQTRCDGSIDRDLDRDSLTFETLATSGALSRADSAIPRRCTPHPQLVMT